MIIIISNQDFLKEEFSCLPEEILLQGQNYSSTRQKSFYSGRLLLQKSLQYFYKCRSLPKLIFQEHGRPILEDGSLPLFSLSHTGDHVAIALGYSALGLDLELIRNRSFLLWQRILSERELDYVKASANPQTLFTLLWTLRESLLKSDGLGLSALSKIKCDLKNLKVYYPNAQSGHISSYILPNNLCMSVYKVLLDPILEIYRYTNDCFSPIALQPEFRFEVDS